ncbi:hypothetical protein [Streptomyces johnsoniae]|uniref:Uncharacterized protein n=1 Tax=Streptomyces johnsoniae TaxID=3075532 RepID=A0ABU2S7H8_9ACTN|nr:hypothetical protein [Streptomyces sp. DSM 41886]MDT0444939.1 hypothetical protein [Streptomyces sp. DSM 41886]
MNVEAAIALVSAAAGSAATEAGRHAWESLMSLTRRLTGRASPEPVDPEDEAAVRALSGRIADRAGADEEFARELRAWAERHRGVIGVAQTRVENTVSGDAQVQNLIQTGTVHGDIRFGA